MRHDGVQDRLHGPLATALVLGLGVSGAAAAALLAAEGTRVTVVDAADGNSLQRRRERLERSGVRVCLGANRESLPEGAFDAAVVSPGIAMDHPWILKSQAAGIPLLGELELGASRCTSPILAVTGTNGKSTAVALCRDVFMAAGVRAGTGGNYGTPVSALARTASRIDWLVLEVSTFQLECCARFRPRVAVLLNLQPDHLDRHADVETYYGLKLRCFADMGPGDTAVVRDVLADRVRAVLPRGVRLTTFGTGRDAAYRWTGEAVDGPGGVVATTGTVFDNPVLGPSAAACFAATAACGIAPAAVRAAVRGFMPLPHRMEVLGVWNGVRYIDDSKATNLAAMSAGVTMAGAPVRLVAGGLLKEENREEVKEILAKHVSAVYLVGKAAATLREAWRDAVTCVMAGTMEQAVRTATEEAQAGDCVLLSPGCASFDQYRNYAARGDHFRTLVHEFAGGRA